MCKKLYLCLTVAAFCATAGAVDTLVFEPGGGQVNISGATLFAPFYPTLASTNDFINADGDFTACNPPAPRAGFYDSDCNDSPDAVDQLAANFVPGGTTTTFWGVNIRSVGSGNGLGEFREFQLCGTVPVHPPSELGQFNRFQYAAGGVASYAGVNASGTPFALTGIDIAVMDVPTVWFVTVDGTPFWNATPGSQGFGLNPTTSWPTPALAGGESNKLQDRCSDCDDNGTLDACLNTTIDTPDAATVFDTLTAWVPIAIIANRGTGVQTISYTQLQHHFVTGRLPSGENLKGITRDAGSGTRNGCMNSLCIDPSWGRGDNVGPKFDITGQANLGPASHWVNCGGSSGMEAAVQNHGLGLGYTGLAGSGRAAADARAGLYEIVDVIKDSGSPLCDANTPVRPTIASSIDNDDPCTGYQIGGPQSFATVGDPNANRAEGDPRKTDNPPVANVNAARYLNNLTDSIASFSGAPGTEVIDFFMPGELLADSFFLPAGIAALPALDAPCSFSPNPDFNATLYQYMLDNNDLGIGSDTPAYGISCAGKVPTRVGLVSPETYTDGSTSGAYNYKDNGGTLRSVSSGQNRSARNRLMGDFNDDSARNVADIAKLMEAVDRQLDFDTTDHGGCVGNMVGDYLIVTIVGDFDGDGNFDTDDVRYFADGLAMDDGLLDRKRGFTDVDTAWLTLKGDGNYFDTTLATCKEYAAGDSRGDVAGSANGPAPGAMPLGADTVVDIADVEYVKANIGDWSNVTQAAEMDLSADMNGDVAVDCSDVAEIVEVILGTKLGDLDLSGCVDNADLADLQANNGVITSGATYAEGDLDCDGDVDGDDESILQGNLGFCVDCNCSDPVFDTAGSGVGNDEPSGAVDMLDFAVFQRCRSSSGGFSSLPHACRCLDRSGPAGVPDRAIDGHDLEIFMRCATGPAPATPVDTACDD